MYAQLSGCRICSHAEDGIVSKMDKDLLDGMDFSNLLFKYSGKFTNLEQPLTRAVLYSHRKHLRKSIPAALLQIPDLSMGQGQEKEASGLSNEVRSEGFDSYLGTAEKDREMIDVLTDSAMDDLLRTDSLLTRAGDTKDSALVYSVRNQIRKALGEMIALNKDMVTPTIGFNIGDTNKKLFVEFLLIVKKSAEATIKNEDVKSAFLLEITSQIRKSKEFKYVLEEEQDRQEIIQNLKGEGAV